VIGLARHGSPVRHAWVYWNDGRTWWILDCTNRREPIRASDAPAGQYIPYYSFGKAGAFRYRTTALLAGSTTTAAAVAERR
jgi:hypothetical protein